MILEENTVQLPLLGGNESKSYAMPRKANFFSFHQNKKYLTVEIIADIKELEHDLQRCSSILDKTNYPKASSLTAYITWMIAMIGGPLAVLSYSVWHLISGAQEFNRRLDFFDSFPISPPPLDFCVAPPSTCGALFICYRIYSEFGHFPTDDGSTCHGINNSFDDHRLSGCEQPFRYTWCDSPGMWPGYIYLVVIMGIIVPVITALTTILTSCCLYDRVVSKNEISPSERQEVKAYAEKHGIVYNNIHETIKKLKQKKDELNFSPVTRLQVLTEEVVVEGKGEESKINVLPWPISGGHVRLHGLVLEYDGTRPAEETKSILVSNRI